MRVRPAVRRCIVDLVNEIAGEDGPGEVGEGVPRRDV